MSSCQIGLIDITVYYSIFPVIWRPSHYCSHYRPSMGWKRTVTNLPHPFLLGQKKIPIMWPSVIPMEKKKVVLEKVYSGSPNAKRYEVTCPWTTIKTSKFLKLAVYWWFLIVGTHHFLIHRIKKRNKVTKFLTFFTIRSKRLLWFPLHIFWAPTQQRPLWSKG